VYFKFNNVITRPETVIYLTPTNLLDNLTKFRQLPYFSGSVGCVLKSNAYGHGLNEITTILRPINPPIFIYDLIELRTLREIYHQDVYLLLFPNAHELIDSVRLEPIFCISDISQIGCLNEVSRTLRKKVRIHLSFDLRFGREGILIDQTGLLIESLRKSPNLIVEGVYGHLSSIFDDPDLAITTQQGELLFEVVRALNQVGYNRLQIHISATGGALLAKDLTSRTNLLRIGGGVYGLSANNKEATLRKSFGLTPVLSLISTISSIKNLPSGYPIGYDRTYTTSTPIKAGLVPIGYGHGYPRALSGKAQVLVQGRRCNVLGRISMNQITVDLTNIPLATQGDPVVLIGKQFQEEISAEELARNCDSICYEITTGLSAFIPRLIT
jgi:alanine racemase